MLNIEAVRVLRDRQLSGKQSIAETVRLWLAAEISGKDFYSVFVTEMQDKKESAKLIQAIRMAIGRATGWKETIGVEGDSFISKKPEKRAPKTPKGGKAGQVALSASGMASEGGQEVSALEHVSKALDTLLHTLQGDDKLQACRAVYDVLTANGFTG